MMNNEAYISIGDNIIALYIRTLLSLLLVREGKMILTCMIICTVTYNRGYCLILSCKKIVISQQ